MVEYKVRVRECGEWEQQNETNKTAKNFMANKSIVDAKKNKNLKIYR